MGPSLDAVLAAARSHDAQVRQRAAFRLGTFATERAARSVVELMLNEQDEFVLETLMWAVAAHGAAAVPHVLKALASPGSDHVRILHALSKLEDHATLTAILPFAADRRPAVAAKAWWAIARIGDPAALPVLTRHVGVGGPEQRAALTRAMKQFGLPALPPLIGLFGDIRPAVREHALEVAVRIISPDARGTASRHRPDPTEREQLAIARAAVVGTAAPEAHAVLVQLSYEFEHPMLAQTAQGLLEARRAT